MNLDSNCDSFAETNPTWNCNVECGELDTTSGRGQEVIDIVRLWGPLETHK